MRLSVKMIFVFILLTTSTPIILANFYNGTPRSIDVPEQPQTTDGLVAHWPLNDAEGLTASDVTGLYTATLTNGAKWTASGRFAGAVQLHGFGAYVAPPTIDVFGNALTLAAWVNIAEFSAAGDQRIISKSTGTADQALYWMLSHLKSGGRNLLRFGLKTGNLTTTLTAASGDLPVNAWFHAAATYDGITMRVYLNGIEVGRAAKFGAIAANAAAPVNIGRSPDGTNYLHGAIDDVRIYERALNQSDIALVMADAGESAPDTAAPTTPSGVQATVLSSTQVHVHWRPSTDNRGVAGYRVRRNGIAVSTNVTSYVESGLAPSTKYTYTVSAFDDAGNESSESTPASAITPATELAALRRAATAAATIAASPIPIAHWRLDEGAGPAAADSAGTRTATLGGNPIWVPGRLSYAVKLNGTSDYLAPPAIDAAGSELTIAAWINHTAFPDGAEQQIISKATQKTVQTYHWTIGTTKVNGQTRLRFRLRTRSGTTSLTARSGSLPTNTWYHAAGTYDGSTMRIYLNGVQVGSTGKRGKVASNSAVPLNIGRNPNGFGYLNGIVDDVRIYDRALGTADILSVMSGGNSTNIPPQALQPAPRYIAFTASADHHTLVTSYVLDIYLAGADPNVAVAFKSSDLGKPTPSVNGEITVDRSALFEGLPIGAYTITVRAVGAGGSARSAAFAFTR